MLSVQERQEEACTSTDQLLERQLLRPYELDLIPERRSATMKQSASEASIAESHQLPSKRRQIRRVGWSKTLVFEAVEEPLLKSLLMRSTEEEIERERQVLKPSTSSSLKKLSPANCEELKKRLAMKVKSRLFQQKRRADSLRYRYNHRKIFDGDINEHRAQSAFLAGVRKSIELRALEEECLEEMMSVPRYDRKRTKSVLCGVKTGLFMHKNKRPPPLNLQAALNNRKTSEEEVFASFKKWHTLHQQQAGKGAVLSPLPPPISGEKTDQSSSSFFFKENANGANTNTVSRIISLDLSKEPRRQIVASSPLSRLLFPEKDLSSSAEKRSTTAGVAAKAPEKQDEKNSAAAAAPHQRDSLIQTKKKAHRRRSSISLDHRNIALLKSRLEKTWFQLHLTTAQKVAFLRKYASLQRAPLLETAAEIWEQASDIFTRWKKLLYLRGRLQAGEMFTESELMATLENARLFCGILPRDLLNATNGEEEGLLDPGLVDGWLSAKVEPILHETYDTLLRRALRELGDRLPELSRRSTPTPPIEVEEEQSPPS